jgi:indolepyruvate ferredoxin oxidoreductase beta subunit
MSKSLQLVIVGVGGQGILTVSDILGTAAIEEGLSAVMSEVHGMAQRGGVVTTEMKIGNFSSPLVADGEADIILGFEPSEAYRILTKASKKTRIVTNMEPLIPTSVSIGQAKYPDVQQLLQNMKDSGLSVVGVNAIELASKAGSAMAGNVVMLGAMSALDNFILSRESMEKALKKRISPKLLDVNLKAFDLGYQSAGK